MSSTRTIWDWVRPYCDKPDFYEVELDDEEYVNVYCTGYGMERRLQIRVSIDFGSLTQIDALERAIRLRTRAAKRRIHGSKEV